MKSPRQLKPTGTWEVLRRIRISKADADNFIAAKNTVNKLAGVNNIVLERDTSVFLVLYDASQVNYKTIVRALSDADYCPVDNWWVRLKSNLYQYSDSNARDNAKAPAPACCNKSPK